MNREQINIVLSAHLKWLRGEIGGQKADLRSANLYGADLGSANLRSADLRSADLRSANLGSANLRSADLRSANLYGAVMPAHQVLPEEGEFSAYKMVRGGVVLTLLVPEYAERVTGYGQRKSRVSHATPIRATRGGKLVEGTTFLSLHDVNFKYEIGKEARVADFNPDVREVCTSGIHLYITMAEAEAEAHI
jgi:hypothetical protein